MKRIGLLLTVLWLVIFPAAAHADEGWKITSFDDAITVRADGHVRVTEKIDVDFGSLQKHGIYRDIPYVYRSGSGTIKTDLTDLVVTDGVAAVPYSLSHSADTLEIKIGNPSHTVSGRQHYVISYTATGILRHADDKTDELYWNVTGNQWPVPIEQASASVTLPPAINATQAACYQGPNGSTKPCAKSSDTTFTTDRPLKTGEGLTIATGWPIGAIPLLAGTGQLPSRSLGSWWLILGSGLLPLLLTLGWLATAWRKRGRDETAGPSYQQTVIAEYDPPAKLKPAEIGMLMDERADLVDLSATVIDLANRGYLTITEIPKQGWLSHKDYELTRLKPIDAALTTYEQQLLNQLFASGATVRLSALQNTFYTGLPAINGSLYQDVTDLGLFDGNPDLIRRKYILAAIALIVSSLILIFITVSATNGNPSVPFMSFLCGTIVSGFLVMLGGWLMPRRTAKGSELFRQAQGYKLFLITTEKDRIPFLEQEGTFTKLLPYAMVFGVVSQFAKVFQALGIEPRQPGWYSGAGPFNAIVFASSMNDFSNALTTTMASAPSGSGSGGGGFSGGGFGGGGGGSW